MDMHTWHWIRPYWLLLYVGLAAIAYLYYRQVYQVRKAQAICDPHLAPYMMHMTGTTRRHWVMFWLFFGVFWMIFALAGPSWLYQEVTTYHHAEPLVILLDTSESMLSTDVEPDRLSRAKFVIQDVLRMSGVGPYGLIAYTSMPFVASPLTEDGHTIDVLLDELHPRMMPIEGNRLDTAMQEAERLIHRAGFKTGHILVMTSEPPYESAIAIAKRQEKGGIRTSIVPILTPSKASDASFRAFAQAGHGKVFVLSQVADLKHWLQGNAFKKYREKNIKALIWEDEGPLFLWLALACIIPAFRRGWLAQVVS